MKKIWLVQLLIIGIVGNTVAQKFTIEGRIGKQADGSTVMLSYQVGAAYQKDSAIVKNGMFRISGKITEPVKGFINLLAVPKPGEQPWERKFDNAEVFLEAGKLTLTSSDGKVSTARVKGGRGQADLAELQRRLKPANARQQLLVDSISKRLGIDEHAPEMYQKLMVPIIEEMDNVKARFITDFPDSDLSLALVKDKGIIIEADKFETLFNSLSERLRNTETAKAIQTRLANAKRTAIGQPAPDFVLNDTTDAPVALSSFKGKYVLVDFWASWCGPCRQENPNLIRAYEKYRAQNFQIIGVSLDATKAPWVQAIGEDGLHWIQVRNQKGTENDVAKKYDIRAVPQNFLLDPNGVIIARNLRSNQLEEKLSEIFKN